MASGGIRIDPTPNPNCLKVSVAGTLSEQPVTIPHAGAAAGNAIAEALFSIDGVRSLFLMKNYCTITKSPDANWETIEPAIAAAFERVLG